MNSAEKSRDLIEALDFDVVPIHPAEYGNFVEIALPAARKKGHGVLAMKTVRNLAGVEGVAEELLYYVWNLLGVSSALVGHYGMAMPEKHASLARRFVSARSQRMDFHNLEARLAHLAGLHGLCWARPDYFDGKMC